MVLSRRCLRPEAWAQAEVAPQQPQLTASNWQSPQARGPSLSQVSWVCVLEGAWRELGMVHGGYRAGGQVGSGWVVATRPFRSPVACLIAHRDLQCDSPGGRAEGECWGSPATLGKGARRRKALPLVGVPGPLLKFDLDWSPSPADVLPSQRQMSCSTSEYSQGLEGDELSVSGTEAHAGFMVHVWFGESWGSTSGLDLGRGLKRGVQGIIEDLSIQ